MYKVLFNGLSLSGSFSGVQYSAFHLANELLNSNPVDIDIRILNLSNNKLHLTNTLLSNDLVISKKESRLKRVFYEHYFLNRFLCKHDFNILHCPAYIMPFRCNCHCVVNIHDVIALDYPQYCSFENSLYFRSMLPFSIINSSKIVAVSHTVKNDILRLFPIEPSKIEVIYNGIDKLFFDFPNVDILSMVKLKYKLPEKFVLFVGNIEPKKNIIGLIEAFEKLLSNNAITHSLVIVGQLGWKYKPIISKMYNSKYVDRIIYLGYIPREEIMSIYYLSDLFVFPSFYEGFGIPPIEAMACNVPVIVSNTGALPEITNKCAFEVNPYSIDSIANGIYTVLTNDNLRTNLINKGFLHSKKFLWSNTSIQTIQLYNKILENE